MAEVKLRSSGEDVFSSWVHVHRNGQWKRRHAVLSNRRCVNFYETSSRLTRSKPDFILPLFQISRISRVRVAECCTARMRQGRAEMGTDVRSRIVGKARAVTRADQIIAPLSSLALWRRIAAKGGGGSSERKPMGAVVGPSSSAALHSSAPPTSSPSIDIDDDPLYKLQTGSERVLKMHTVTQHKHHPVASHKPRLPPHPLADDPSDPSHHRHRGRPPPAPPPHHSSDSSTLPPRRLKARTAASLEDAAAQLASEEANASSDRGSHRSGRKPATPAPIERALPPLPGHKIHTEEQVITRVRGLADSQLSLKHHSSQSEMTLPTAAVAAADESEEGDETHPSVSRVESSASAKQRRSSAELPRRRPIRGEAHGGEHSKRPPPRAKLKRGSIHGRGVTAAAPMPPPPPPPLRTESVASSPPISSDIPKLMKPKSVKMMRSHTEAVVPPPPARPSLPTSVLHHQRPLVPTVKKKRMSGIRLSSKLAMLKSASMSVSSHRRGSGADPSSSSAGVPPPPPSVPPPPAKEDTSESQSSLLSDRCCEWQSRLGIAPKQCRFPHMFEVTQGGITLVFGFGTVSSVVDVDESESARIDRRNAARLMAEWMRWLKHFAIGKCVFTGFLTKQGGSYRSWKRRYFEVYDTLVMYYYDPDHSSSHMDGGSSLTAADTGGSSSSAYPSSSIFMKKKSAFPSLSSISLQSTFSSTFSVSDSAVTKHAVSKPLGQVDLSQMKYLERGSFEKFQRKHVIILETGDRKWYFECQNEPELKLWCSLFSNIGPKVQKLIFFNEGELIVEYGLDSGVKKQAKRRFLVLTRTRLFWFANMEDWKRIRDDTVFFSEVAIEHAFRKQAKGWLDLESVNHMEIVDLYKDYHRVLQLETDDGMYCLMAVSAQYDADKSLAVISKWRSSLLVTQRILKRSKIDRENRARKRREKTRLLKEHLAKEESGVGDGRALPLLPYYPHPSGTDDRTAEDDSELAMSPHLSVEVTPEPTGLLLHSSDSRRRSNSSFLSRPKDFRDDFLKRQSFDEAASQDDMDDILGTHWEKVLCDTPEDRVIFKVRKLLQAQRSDGAQITGIVSPIVDSPKRRIAAFPDVGIGSGMVSSSSPIPEGSPALESSRTSLTAEAGASRDSSPPFIPMSETPGATSVVVAGSVDTESVHIHTAETAKAEVVREYLRSYLCRTDEIHHSIPVRRRKMTSPDESPGAQKLVRYFEVNFAVWLKSSEVLWIIREFLDAAVDFVYERHGEMLRQKYAEASEQAAQSVSVPTAFALADLKAGSAAGSSSLTKDATCVGAKRMGGMEQSSLSAMSAPRMSGIVDMLVRPLIELAVTQAVLTSKSVSIVNEIELRTKKQKSVLIAKCSKLRGRTQGAFGIQVKFIDADGWTDAIHELITMQGCRLPNEKLDCLKSVARIIHETQAAKQTEEMLDADALMNVAVFVYVHASTPKRPAVSLAELLYIEGLIDNETARGEGGYYLTVFRSVVDYLLSVVLD